MLAVQGLDAGYGPVQVLHAVALHVNPGEAVCLIGANGAGKSTVLSALAGLIAPRAGSIRINGRELAGRPAHEVVRAGMALVPEGRRVFPRLSVTENLRLGAWQRSDHADIARDLERAFTLFPVLAERRHQAAGTLSGGEQQMLAISRALMSRPRLLLMDEPSMGVAPLLVARIFATIRRLHEDEGMALLVVEQNAHLALELADRAYVLEHGRILLHGPAGDLRNDPRVKAAYLGE